VSIEQKQHLLAYLGYYVGDIDGIWGQLSKVACRSFQQDFGGIAVDGICGTETEKALQHAVAYGMTKRDFWDTIKYFTRDEFKCKCGKHCNGFPVEPKEKLVKLLDGVREHFNAPIYISSGLRCEIHNSAVGGVSNSRHMYGKAVDFCVSGISSNLVLPYVQKLTGVRYSYAIDSNFVHMDID
jgi:uncharacterized protein YcbK (DUF882 family)